MNNIRVFYAKVSLSWGFIIRHKGTTASQPAYPLPTPTTIVGAFVYPLAKLLKLPLIIQIEKSSKRRKMKSTSLVEWGEGKLISDTMKPFLEATVTASAGLISSKITSNNSTQTRSRMVQVGLATYSEVSRIISSPYKSGGSYDEAVKRIELMQSEFFTKSIPTVLPVQALGATYAPALKVELMWAIDIAKLSEKLKDELGIDIDIEKLDDLASKAVYGVVRIGSKEGIVALEEAQYIKNPIIEKPGEIVASRLYIEEACAKALDPSRVSKTTLPNLKYALTTYYVPCHIGSNNVIIPLDEETPHPQFEILEPCRAIVLPGFKGVVGVFPLERRD